MMCCRLRTSPRIPRSRRRAPPALWKIASKTAKLVIAPVEAACLKLFHSDFYSALALRLRTGEEYLPDMLVEHLLSVGYTRVDVVEMPGQLTLRGGILDVYSPEMDRPVRIDFFGDEIESIRKFDPETQRSPVFPGYRTAAACLTEIPITEKVLEAINARLTRKSGQVSRLRSWKGGETPSRAPDPRRHPHRRSHHLPRLGVLSRPSPVPPSTLLDLLGPATRVFVEEPAMIKNQGERWWNKVEQRHDRSGIGNLIRPEDIYVSPWDLRIAARLLRRGARSARRGRRPRRRPQPLRD